MRPRYAEDIVTCVKTNSSYTWFVGPYDDWFMDLVAYNDAVVRAGLASQLDFYVANRGGIPIVDEATLPAFLEHINDTAVPVTELRRRVAEHDFDESLLEIMPSLFVDGDARSLLSLYYEPFSTRLIEWAPAGWHTEFDEKNWARLAAMLPAEQQYWMRDGRDLSAGFDLASLR